MFEEWWEFFLVENKNGQKNACMTKILGFSKKNIKIIDVFKIRNP